MTESNDDRDRLNPTALTIDGAAMVLTKTGGSLVTLEMLQADIAEGAPVNADGTLNLVHYAAWLVKNVAEK